MYKRLITSELESLISQYPIVTVVGPRQSGKTTLVKTTLPHLPYANLEEHDTRNQALEDPRGFLNRFPGGAILDEIQRVPQLLSYIQALVDNDGRKGLFVLTGSHQRELHQAISQSLAGRTALLTLLPLSLEELGTDLESLSVDELILKGGYPRVHQDNQNPIKAYRNYFQTYVERDVRQISAVKDLVQFERFIRICAGRIGQVLNLEGIGNEVGISSHTVKEWLSILEASFIIFRLQPYYENFGKRLIKSPKLYFTDVGLAAHLLSIETPQQVSRDPLRGNLFENLVILELMKTRFNKGLDPNLYFYRDVRKNEIDIIYRKGNSLVPIEIKSAMTYSSSFLKSITFFQDLLKERAPEGYLIFAGTQEQSIHKTQLLNYIHASQIVS